MSSDKYRIIDGILECYCVNRGELGWYSHKDLTLEFLKESRRENWYDESAIPMRYIDATFEIFERERQPVAFDFCRNYAVKFNEYGHSLILHMQSANSGFGVGKTHLGIAILRHVMENEKPLYVSKSNTVFLHPCPVLFISEPELLNRVTSTYNRDWEDKSENEGTIIQKLIDIQLLMIDDIGKHRPTNLEFTRRILFSVIDGRYQKEKPVIITANGNLKDLSKHLGGAISDRLVGMAGTNVCEMSGESYRFKEFTKKHRQSAA